MRSFSWSEICSFFRSMFGGTTKPSTIAQMEIVKAPRADVIELTIPEATEAAPAEPDVEDSFLLDEPRSLGDLVCSVLSEPHTPFALSHERAFFHAVEEFARRGMASLVISMPQFAYEWNYGVMRTVEYKQVGGNSGMIVPGCPLSDFTRIVDALVKSAAHRPPSVSALLLGKRHCYRVEIGHGTIRTIYRMHN